MVNASGPEFLAHHPGQGAAIGLGDVRYLEEGGIQLVACAQGRDQGDVQLQGSLCQIQLAGHQIDGVHDVIVPAALREEAVPMSGVIETVDRMELCIRIDVPQTGGHRLRLGLTQGGVEGLQLAVQVGEGNGVAVHQGQLADSGPGQAFGGVAAHAAQPQQQHVGPSKPGLGLRAPQHLVAEKGMFHNGPPCCKQVENVRL